MAHSNRPSKRPDPTIAPSHYDPKRGRHAARSPFTPSARLEKVRAARELTRDLGRRVRHWEVA